MNFACMLLCSITCLLAGLGVAPAEEFYKGKTLTILVGYAPGGGYDTNARAVARYLGRHIPGNPAVVVANMPGAGSLKSIEYLDLSAPKDGTFIDAFDFTQIGNSRVSPEKVKVDFRKFNWIGSVAQDLAVCYVWHTVGAHSIAELGNREIQMGRTNPGSSSDLEQKILKNIFKVNVHSVAGYLGSAEAMVAVERGELNGGCLTWSSLQADWIVNHKIIPILKMSSATAPDLPASVPNAVETAPSERDRRIIRVLTAAGDVGKPFVASLAVPADRVAILREAFAATMKDPAFLADAERLRLPVSPKSAAEAVTIVDEIYAAPDEIVEAAKNVAAD